MKLKYYAHSCFALRYAGGAVVVTDPYDETVTYPPCDENCTIALLSHDHFDHNHTASLKGDFQVIRQAGNYDVQGLHITAIPCFHDKEAGALRGENLMMRIEGEGLSIAHLGDLGHMLDAQQLAALQDLDVLMLPIGGTYTIDTPEAEELIRQLKPRHVIAMHFRTEDYDINISTCDAFTADMQAVRMPQEMEITRENLASLPKIMILNYK